MSKSITSTQFASLFKRYRLRSEIETLSEFGDLLAQEGFIYDSSLFTKWQNGTRIPADRTVLLAVCKLFLKLGGIQVIEECNRIFESVNQKNLSDNEIRILQQYIPLLIDIKKNGAKTVFFFASPYAEKFDSYIDRIYKEIELSGYTHLNYETQTHRLRNLMKRIDNGEDIDEELMEYKIIIKDFINKIKIADICVFETSFRSIGGGYKIHLALTLSKPTVILYYKENKPHIFSAVIDKNLTLKSYNEHNLKKVITRVLEAAKNKL